MDTKRTHPGALRGIRVLAIGLLIGWIVAPAIGGSSYTFINIADNTGPLGNSFSNPAINNSGTVVFGASIGGGDTGIFTGNGGPLTTIVLGGDGNSNVSSFVDINENDLVAVRVSENISERGIFTGNGGALTLVATTDENPYSDVDLPSINTPGQVAFYGIDASGPSGFYRAQGFGNYTTLVDTSGSFVSFGGRVTMNDSGTAAFVGNSASGGGVYTGDGGPLTTIADTSGTFTSVSSVSINNDGTVAFFAGNVSKQGIYTGDGGPLTTIADTDGQFMLFTFNDACINNNGDVAFIATADSGIKGIFTGPDVVADKVIQLGDPLFGSTLNSTSTLIGPKAMNDHGDIAFEYFLNDGRTGIAVALAGDSAPPGDLNGDNIVDTVDLLLILGAWGPCPQPCPPSCVGDINEDCAVDVVDLLILLSNWS